MTTEGLAVVVVGASLGGIAALECLLRGLPADFEMPLVVVQHRGKDSHGEGLRRHLEGHCALRMRSLEDKDPLEPGHVYIAPADYHVLVDVDGLALSTDDLVNYSRPSIDVLFESAADRFRDRVAGVLLTGANRDGASGLVAIKKAGGIVVVQDPATAESPIMPKAALAALAEIPGRTADRVLPIEQIASYLVELGRSWGSPRRARQAVPS